MKPNTQHHVRAGLIVCGAMFVMSTAACKGNDGAAKPEASSDNQRANLAATPTSPAVDEQALFPVAREVTEQGALAAIKNALIAPFPKAVAALAADAKFDADVASSAATPIVLGAWQVGPATMAVLVGVAGEECAACGMKAFEASMTQNADVWQFVAARYLGDLADLGSFGAAPNKVAFRHTATHRAWLLTGGISHQGESYDSMAVYLADHGTQPFAKALSLATGADNGGQHEPGDPAHVAWNGNVTVAADLSLTLVLEDLTGRAPAKASAPLTIVFDQAKAAYELAKLPPGLRLDTDFGEPGTVVPTHRRFAR